MSSPTAAAEVLQIRLRLRPELRCRQQTLGDNPYYQLEDPLTRRFYRLGRREWELARQFDGRRTLGEILEQAAQAAVAVAGRRDAEAQTEPASDAPPTHLTPSDAVRLARWLVQSQLATVEGRLTHPLLSRAPQRRSLPSWLNPAFMRIPLFNPERLLAAALPWLGWTLRPAAVAGWAVVVSAAVFRVVTDWERFTAPLPTILAPQNWLYLLLAWVALKVVHELYHGLVCQRYGGQVPVCGIALILFSPVAYVDVTSSWRFRSKWHRIYTAAAGMYAELFVASLMALVWAHTDRPLLTQICHNVILMASVSTLLFNGNFLMRFDGYYIFSDLLNLQNLYGRGQQYVRALTRRYVLGIASDPRTSDASPAMIVKLYGIASLIWRILFYVGMVLTAATMFRGAGVLISLMLGTLWILWPTAKFVHYLIHDRGPDAPDRQRFAKLCGTVALAAVLIGFLPWPGGIVATGVVDYDPIASIRAASPGFVQTLHVSSGQSVQPGAPLVTISNPQTEMELTSVRLAAEQAEIRARIMQDEGDVAAYQVEKRHLESLVEQESELAQKVESLQLSAPTEGRVIGRGLELLQQQYLAGGSEILAIGNDQRKSVLVAVSQADIEYFLNQVGTRVQIRVAGQGRLTGGGVLTKVNPRASQQLFHPALAAAYGGPLPVTVNPGSGSGESEPPAMLVEPHFRATVGITPQQASQLRAGQLVRIRLTAGGRTVASHLWNAVDSWVRHKLKTL